jgi:hypothetical protein
MMSRSFRCRVLIVSALVGVSLTACIAATGAHHTGSPTTAPVSVIVKLADAQPLGNIEDDNVQVNLTDKLSPPQANDTLYFGEIDDYSPEDDQNPIAAIPIIALHPGQDWKAVSLTGPSLVDAGWKYVGAGPSKKEIWGVLDTSAGDSRSHFVVAHSVDGGSTFSLRIFQKPCKLATVSDFVMTREGRGHVSVSLDTECGKIKPGSYSFDTIDDGKTWSDVPRFEPDAMIRADEVPDDEQPEPKAGASKTMFKSHSSAVVPGGAPESPCAITRW